MDSKFTKTVVTTLAKRAANRCSNPDCGAITSGPAEEKQRSVNIGQAAHIFGANPGSARYDPTMSPAVRSDITNAIWLCGNCHKLIDNDPIKYPSGLLFEWQREHEKVIAEHIGKASAAIRHRYERRHLEEFGKLSYLSERIIIEKGDLWEYHLTLEVLRFEMREIVQRWSALKRGLYVRPSERIDKQVNLLWIADRMAEAQNIAHALGELMNVEFARAWGEPGVAGNEADIIRTCRLFAEACGSALTWEETVRFATVDEIFQDLRDLFIGIVGAMIDESLKVQEFLAEMLSGEPPSGVHRLTITFELPDGWNDLIEAAMDKAADEMQQGF